MWERRIGRPMTAKENLDRGCIGMTMNCLRRKSPPLLTLSFADPRAHALIHSAESPLAPRDIADNKARHLFEKLRYARHDVVVMRERFAETTLSHRISTAQAVVDDLENTWRQAVADAAEIKRRMPPERFIELSTTRLEAKLVGGQRTFDLVSSYATRLQEILHSCPSNVREFERLISRDPLLAPLQNVARGLPAGNLADIDVQIFLVSCWSGQVLPPSGKWVTNGRALDSFDTAASEPNPRMFAPDPVTGQVDIAGYFGEAKPYGTNYDYAFHQDGSWWHANHGVSDDPNDQMVVLQSSPDGLFAGSEDFDTMLQCIGYVNRSA